MIAAAAAAAVWLSCVYAIVAHIVCKCFFEYWCIQSTKLTSTKLTSTAGAYVDMHVYMFACSHMFSQSACAHNSQKCEKARHADN